MLMFKSADFTSAYTYYLVSARTNAIKKIWQNLYRIEDICTLSSFMALIFGAREAI